jgi:hypothetical protein
MPIDSMQGIQLEKGLIYKNKSLFRFGTNAAVGTTQETIWDQGGLYSYLSSAATLKVSSSNANDSSSGTGARTILVEGLDSGYQEISEIVSLNGQTAVLTSKQYLRVFTLTVLTAGSGGTAAGDIYIGDGALTLGVPATVYGKISVGENKSLMAIWTVPAGHTLYLQTGTISTGTESGSQYITARLKVRPLGGVFQTAAIVTMASAFIPFDFGVARSIPEKTDVEARAISSGQDQQVSISFSAIYEKDS